MRVLCTICARSGSKGVPNKNIRELLGKPLIAHTIEYALKSKFIDRVVVSSNSTEIISMAKQYGAEAPFTRPESMAWDNSPKLPVIQHAVRYYMEELGYNPDYVMDLDPTSPLRIEEDSEKCMDLIVNDPHCDTVITGYRSNKNPYFNMVEINRDGFAHLSKKNDNQITRRQDASIVYAMNASIYLWKTSALFKQSIIFNGKVKLVEMPEERSIDIDSEVDFKLVALLMRERKK